jgi:hypothetical protein
VNSFRLQFSRTANRSRSVSEVWRRQLLSFPIMRAEPGTTPFQMAAIRFGRTGTQETAATLKYALCVREDDALHNEVGDKPRCAFDYFLLVAGFRCEQGFKEFAISRNFGSKTGRSENVLGRSRRILSSVVRQQLSSVHQTPTADVPA